jgi:hypothetical protein
MAENSNFSSFFEGDSEIDILSSVSNKVNLNPIPFSGFEYYGRYFYLGNLLKYNFQILAHFLLLI